MKILIIEFCQFNGIRNMRATHYYIDGKRVSKNSYNRCGQPAPKDYEHLGTRQWSDRNKDGVRRDYTEILFKRREKRTSLWEVA